MSKSRNKNKQGRKREAHRDHQNETIKQGINQSGKGEFEKMGKCRTKDDEGKRENIIEKETKN